MDDDRTSHTAEFIGLAIIATSEGSNGSLGIWQHTTDPFGGWDNITVCLYASSLACNITFSIIF